MGALAGAFVAGGALGGGVAWWAHRRTRLSAWNFYAAALLALLAWLAALLMRRVELLPVVGFFGSASVLAASMSRRYRLSALGAGGELRGVQRSRRMLWAVARERGRAGAQRRPRRGERTRIEGQGELVRERAWPERERFVPMSADGRGRVPTRAGRHLLIVGATGSGKTVSARRW